MEDLLYIYRLCKSNFLISWKETEIEECIHKLQTMNKEKLIVLRHCRLMTAQNPLYTKIVELLYKEQLGKTIQLLNSLSIDELIIIVLNTKSSFQKQKIAEILYQRYDHMSEEDRNKVYGLLIDKGFIPTKYNDNS